MLGDFPADAAFPYRYVNREAVAIASIRFAAGQQVQFLPGAKIVGYGSTNQAVTILSDPQSETRLFARGDVAEASAGAVRSIVLRGGAIKLNNGGAVALAPLVPPRFVRLSFNPEFRYAGLTWERGYGNDDAVQVERSLLPFLNWRTIATVAGAQTGCVDSDLLPNTNYLYRVRASGGGKFSAYSAEIGLRTSSW
jgi:hypothetical protein